MNQKGDVGSAKVCCKSPDLRPSPLRRGFDFRPDFVVAERFEPAFERLKRSPVYKQASFEIAIARLDSPPSLLFRANEAIELGGGAQGLRRRSHLIPLSAGPKIEIEDDIDAKFQTSRPKSADLHRHAIEEDRKIIDGGIVAIEAGHPLVMREANRRKLLLELASKSRFART
jgi:hypothetical protein